MHMHVQWVSHVTTHVHRLQDTLQIDFRFNQKSFLRYWRERERSWSSHLRDTSRISAMGFCLCSLQLISELSEVQILLPLAVLCDHIAMEHMPSWMYMRGSLECAPWCWCTFLAILSSNITAWLAGRSNWAHKQVVIEGHRSSYLATVVSQ